MKIVMIEWEDTASYGDRWMEKEEACFKTTHPIISIGVLYQYDDKQLKIFQSESAKSKDYHNVLVIPRKCVKRLRPLGTVKYREVIIGREETWPGEIIPPM
jgi:hypothetical protein